jgi:hypothetical protein
MSGPGSPLEIHIHCVDGHVGAFVQPDGAVARRILEQVHPTRLFAQHQLMISGEGSLTVFPSAAVVRVDLVTEECPEWPFAFGVSDVAEITAEEFTRRLDPDAPRPEQPGGTVVRHIQIELTNGEPVYCEARAHFTPRAPVEIAMFFQHLLSGPGLHARRLGGGVLILNPAHVTRLSTYPGPPEAPPGAWAAEPFSGEGATLDLDIDALD